MSHVSVRGLYSARRKSPIPRDQYSGKGDRTDVSVLARVFDEVASCCHVDSVGVFLLWAEVNNDAGVKYDSVL